MPELPEVHTTVAGIKKEVVGKKIKEVWSDFHVATAHGHRENLKNKKHYKIFVESVAGAKIVDAERKGKNILIHLNNDSTIVVHMKMTGHLMVGKYKLMKAPPPAPSPKEMGFKRKKLSVEREGAGPGRSYEQWQALEEGPLQDPYNRFIHFALSLSDGRSLVLSDTRKFASVYITKTQELHAHEHLSKIGPDPFDLSQNEFVTLIQKAASSKKTAPIKSILMDQSVIAGIGNIYSDEILFEVGVHPESVASKVPTDLIKAMYKSMIKILAFSIKHGGDSKSDYRNIYGEKGGFQNFHKVYGKRGKKCAKKGCSGIISRIVVRGRSSHFCPIHQKIYK